MSQALSTAPGSCRRPSFQSGELIQVRGILFGVSDGIGAIGDAFIGNLVLNLAKVASPATGRHKEIPLSPSDQGLGDIGDTYRVLVMEKVPASDDPVASWECHRGLSPPEGTLHLKHNLHSLSSEEKWR
jgi:hypothetical protein